MNTLFILVTSAAIGIGLSIVVAVCIAKCFKETPRR